MLTATAMRVAVVFAVVLTVLALTGVANASPGDLDTTFGGTGTVSLFGGNPGDRAYDVAIQPDGKIVLAGAIGDHMAVARLNPDGSPDTGFGTGGLKTVDVADTDFALGVAIQPDGKIVIAGTAAFAGPTDLQVGVLRLTPEGQLDSGFGGSGTGIITYGFGNDQSGNPAADRGSDVALLPDGKILVAGSGGGATDFLVTRLNANGTLDGSFAPLGNTASIDLGGTDEVNRMAVDPQGQIVLAGYTLSLNTGVQQAGVARFTASGVPVNQFGSGGKRVDPAAQQYTGVASQADGKIVLTAYRPGGVADFGVARMNPDASYDPLDGHNIATIDFGSDDLAWGLALQPDGKIVAIGQRFNSYGVARLQPGGQLDTTFSGDGKATVDFATGDHPAIPQSVALEPDGGIVIVGTDQNRHFAAARLLGDPPGGQDGGPGGGNPNVQSAAPRCFGKRATIVGTARRDVLKGTKRADVIVTLGGNDVVKALGGNDRVCAGAGNDRVLGGAGNDLEDGGAGKDSLFGQAGNDKLKGGAGNDHEDGGAGKDNLSGGSGKDTCKGGAGHDHAKCERKSAI